jgi:HK97 family phage major capsid protein
MTTESIQAMRERRNALAKETRNLLDKTPGNAWDEKAQKQYDEKIDEITRIDAAIEREQKLLDLNAEKHFRDLGGHERKPDQTEVRKIYNKLLRQGERALSADEWGKVRNTMSTTTGSEGGFTVQTEVAKTLVEALKDFGGVRLVSQLITTEQGNPMNFPTTDGTAEEGELVAENVSATDQDATFGTVSLNVYKYSSKVITVPIELLQDSSVDIEGLVNRRITERVGRITNRHFTVGTGTAQPNGVVTASTAGKIGAVSATPVITYNDLVELQESVDEAYQKLGRGTFMMSQQARRDIRLIKDTNGRPIFNPGYEVGVPGGAPDMLLGAPLVINNQMAVPAPGAKSILFGDFQYYIIRDAMQIQLFRFADSPYIKKGQIGFLAWMRSGGNYIDAGGGAIKHFQHGAAA